MTQYATPTPSGQSTPVYSPTLSLPATVLVALNCLYMLLVVIDNTTDYASNLAFVEHVLAMDTTNFGAPPGTRLDPAVMWRSITNPWMQNAAYIAIIAWESATAVVLAIALTLRSRRDGQSNNRARQLSVAGLLMIIVLFAGGFICIGGEWFAMYRSTTWNGLDPAFRNTVLAILALILVGRPARPSEHD